jgi:CheY-like chemotaxis protein
MSLIVIVDDRATNRKIFTKLAASIEADAEVHSFGDPAHALNWLTSHTPDLIITDYKMPTMDGAEFIRRIRRRSQLAEIPVIVITVYEEREFRLQALQAGATDFLHRSVQSERNWCGELTRGKPAQPWTSQWSVQLASLLQEFVSARATPSS